MKQGATDRRIIISPRLVELLEQIIDNDPDVCTNFRDLDGEQMCMLLDLERKLKALRETTVKAFIRSQNTRSNN